MVLNTIFQKDSNGNFTKKSLLYQDIINYSFEIDKMATDIFRFTDLGKYLIKKNNEFNNYYSGSNANVSITNRIAARRQIIDSRINDLMELQLIVKKGEVKAKKNETLTPIYSFTTEGRILAYLMLYRANQSKKSTDKQWIMDKINELIQLYFSDIISYEDEVALRFFARLLKEQAYYKVLLELVCNELYEESKADFKIYSVSAAFEYAINAFRRVKKYEIISQVFILFYLETLDEMDEKSRNIIIYLTKLEIQYKICYRCHSKELGAAVVDNASGTRHNIVTIGICRKCDYTFVAVIEFKDYLFYTTGKMPDKICIACGAKKEHLNYFVPPFQLIHLPSTDVVGPVSYEHAEKLKSFVFSPDYSTHPNREDFNAFKKMHKE
jgi:hypothetical protein